MARISNKQKFQRDFINWINDLFQRLSQITTKYADELRDELNSIAQSAIDDFYDDYTPNTYNRHGDIYNTYKVTVEIDEFEINYKVDFDPKYMQYHGGIKDYLFNIVFEEGWHGGAISGNGHPDPGTPWYRNLGAISQARKLGIDSSGLSPSSFWLREAERSNSPYETIKSNMNKYYSTWEKKYIHELNEYLKNKLSELKKIFNEMKRR